MRYPELFQHFIIIHSVIRYDESHHQHQLTFLTTEVDPIKQMPQTLLLILFLLNLDVFQLELRLVKLDYLG